jgi:hypothetical protein
MPYYEDTDTKNPITRYLSIHLLQIVFYLVIIFIDLTAFICFYILLNSIDIIHRRKLTKGRHNDVGKG